MEKNGRSSNFLLLSVLVAAVFIKSSRGESSTFYASTTDASDFTLGLSLMESQDNVRGSESILAEEKAKDVQVIILVSSKFPKQFLWHFISDTENTLRELVSLSSAK